MSETALDLTFQPLTAERWPDLEKLFGPKGAYAGCWCMWWRIPRREFERQKGEQNRVAFEVLVKTGNVPGILAYFEGEPVGWCAVEPRTAYPRLDSSRNLKAVDEQPVWSVTCLFIARKFRRKGVSTALLKAAVAHVAKQGGKIVEGYPSEPKKENVPDVFAYTGFVSSFQAAGFKEVARRAETRPIMRLEIELE